MTSLPARPRSLRPETVEIDPGRFRYSLWENVSIGVWQNQATASAAERIHELSLRNAKRFPHGYSNVVFIMAGAPAPTPEGSKILARFYEQGATSIACIGIVLQGEGFWASGMRSMVLNMRMDKRSGMPIRVVDDIDSLLGWLPVEHARKTGVELDPDLLRRALTDARDRGTEA